MAELETNLMKVRDCVTRLRGYGPYEEILARIRAGSHGVDLDGPVGPARSLIAAAAGVDTQRPVIMVCEDMQSAREACSDARFFRTTDSVMFLPDRGLSPYEASVVSPQINTERMRAMTVLPHLQRGVVVTTITALHEALPGPSRLKTFEIEIAVGLKLDREDLLHRLAEQGYRRTDLVELWGEFSVRGAILDIAAPALGQPVRVEMEGDEVISLRFFDPVSQRSLETVEKILIGPAAEAMLSSDERMALLERLPEALSRRGASRLERLRERLETGGTLEGEERYIPWVYANPARLVEYFPPQALVFLCEPEALRASSENLLKRTEEMYEGMMKSREPVPRPLDLFAAPGELWRNLEGWVRVNVRQFASASGEGHRITLPVRAVRYGVREFENFTRDAYRWTTQGASILIASELPEEGESVEARLKEAALLKGPLKLPVFVEGNLSMGVEIPEARIVLLPASDVLGARLKRAAERRRVPKTYRDAFLDLKTGDFVVHEDYGIGIYQGVISLSIDGVRQDFFMIEYAGAEKLYLPVDQVHRVQKFMGTGRPPQLSRLGTEAWDRTKARVKESLRKFAEELLKLYAERQVAPARPFGAQKETEQAIAESFPYEETEDQERAIREVGQDLSQERPMDRLLCGDVGYGKTEVALRAAFRVAMQGAQAAILVPTTILAAQHYQNFRARLENSPVRVELLSRSRGPAERKKVLAQMEAGKVDIIIGTHQLLSKAVKFRNLGLLVIDEEHRFGVGQKEKLKALRRNVHVLTLTATPIPRTLNMGLAGLRDLSVIESPPPGRLSVITHVLEENPLVVREAILREIARKGQVFYLHNRVQTIRACVERVRGIVPEALIAMAHGQMAMHELEKAMSEFMEKRVDVLVCTSIIGSGLDLPNANTLMVERAETFGLADLYQLRGRVGRSLKQAYAYLFFSPHGVPTLNARRRLAAMLEFGELGSGFRLALRDLEIRGAGNLLGPQQHGIMQAVGFELYGRLLEATVRELRGEVSGEKLPPQISLGIEAYLPESYVADSRAKLEIYKRLGACEDMKQLEEFGREIRDRFGAPPREVRTLEETARLRIAAGDLGLVSLKRDKGRAVLTFRSAREMEKLMRAGALRGKRTGERVITLDTPREPEEFLGRLKNVLEGALAAAKGKAS